MPDSLKSDLSLLPDSAFRWGNTNIGYVAYSDSLTVHKIDFENNKLIYTGINMSEIRNKRIFNRAYNYDSKTNWIFTRSGVYEIKFYESDYEIIKIHNWGEIDYSELTTSFVEGKKDNQTVWLGSEDSKLIRWLPYNRIIK